MKQAFLIIAHNEPEMLKTLVYLLDHPNVDIYIHIDAKSDMKQFNGITTYHSTIRFINERIDVKWGDYSQILTEISLFEAAHKHGGYAYYHLLSGVDLPIKPINHILDWFEKNTGYEYIGADRAARKYRRRMHRRYFFITRKRNIVTTLLLAVQKILGIRWNRRTEVWMGPNWGSFTDGFVGQLLANKKWIERHFRYSFCGDELYKPTLMRHLGIEGRDRGCVRLIDWDRGQPYTWQDKDYDELVNSDKLFARKFSLIHKDLIERLKSDLYLNKA